MDIGCNCYNLLFLLCCSSSRMYCKEELTVGEKTHCKDMNPNCTEPNTLEMNGLEAEICNIAVSFHG